MNYPLIIGMPHLLSNSELNLNHVAKVFGDYHWRFMNSTPSDCYINDRRIYQSFLKIDFLINDTFREDLQFTVNVTGNYIDDYIFKTDHRFGNNCISMHTIGVYINNKKIQKTTHTGKRNKDFWNKFNNLRKNNISLVDPVTFPTYYSIDFNCAKILYCANYLKFVYQYCDVVKISPKITSISFFGNISPGDELTVAKNNNDLVILCNDELIAIVEYTNNIIE